MAPLVILPLLLACKGDPKLPAGSAEQPDVVLVSIDTLRADHLSAYGYARPTSPFIDSLAAQGTRFAFARSASPWTLPSHTTMMTGQLPTRHMIIEDKLKLGEDKPVLAELFHSKGYATGGAVATFYVSRLFGFQRGFDFFEDFGVHSDKANLERTVKAHHVVGESLEWWSEQEPGKPVFLFVHVYDVHYHYDPPDPYGSMFDREPQDGDIRYKNYAFHKKKPVPADQMEHQIAQYDESIRYVDDQLKRIGEAAALAGRQLRWVITADHGEEFGERGSWGHGHTLYAEQLHVPLIISGPGLPQGKVVEAPVGTHDIAPTLAAWIGADGLQPDGQDLAGAMAGGALAPRLFPAETSRFDTNRLGIYADGLRLEWELKGDRAELFDPHGDPLESKDLAAQKADAVHKLQAELEAAIGHPWEARVAGVVKTPGVILKGGRSQELRVQPGDCFAVVPPDAPVQLLAEGGKGGRWSQVGKEPPPEEGAGLYLHRSGTTGRVDLDAETLKALEALGYVQEEAPAPEAPPDPAAPTSPAPTPEAGAATSGGGRSPLCPPVPTP